MTEKSFEKLPDFFFSNLEHHLKTLSKITKNPDSSTAKDLLTLQRGLTGKRELSGAGYMNKENLLNAYAAYYFPVSYQQIFYALRPLSLPKSSVVRILDFGCGPGSASSLLLDWIREKNPQCRIELLLLDFSQSALNVAKSFFLSEYKNIAVKTCRANFESESISSLLKKNEIHSDFNIAVSCHLLNELWKNESERISLLTDLCTNVFEKIAKDGLMILCEPALLKTSRDLISVRDSLCKKNLNLISPCPKNKACPALFSSQGQSCHAEFSCAPVKQLSFLSKKAHLERTSVKMTYFVFKKSKAENKENTENPRCISGRIVSEAMLNKAGRVRFLLCDGSRRVSVSAKKDDEHAKKIGFFSLKRFDFVKFFDLEERGESFGIKNESSLFISSL